MPRKKKEQAPVEEPTAAPTPEPETDNRQPETAAAKPPRLSGEQLKAQMRQKRREERLAEKGY